MEGRQGRGILKKGLLKYLKAVSVVAARENTDLLAQFQLPHRNAIFFSSGSRHTRLRTVTGVQTCALPLCSCCRTSTPRTTSRAGSSGATPRPRTWQIGRASWRERGEISGVALSLKKQ